MSASTTHSGELFAIGLRLSGTVLEHAHMAVRPIDADGHQAHVLIMDVETDGATRGRCRLEQPFPPGQHDQCEAAARRYRRGTRITFEAPIGAAFLVVPNVSHVHVHNPKDAS